MNTNDQTQLPIGVFDSGVGGLTVLRALQAELPHENFLYLGDTARLPYGTKSKATVTQYTEAACRILIERQIKCLVIACNTATTLALQDLKQTLTHLPIIGVLEPGVHAAIAASKTGRIAVLATESTVKSRGYQDLIEKLLPQAQVSAQSCSLFVALAEEGWMDDPVTVTIAERYIRPLIKEHNPDTLLLGCTHFPALLPAIRQVAGDAIHIIDSAHTTALVTKNLLEQHDLLNKRQQNGYSHFLVTDSPQRFHMVAKRFLNTDISESNIEWVDGALR